jgi:hypothetical protein
MGIRSIFFFLSLSILGQGASAAGPTVKITAFHYAGTNTRAAELCGQLDGTRPAISGAKVVVDGNSSSPTYYYTLVGNDGAFCITVITYNGVADAFPWTPGEHEADQSSRAFIAPSVRNELWSHSVGGDGSSSSQAFAESGARSSCQMKLNQWRNTCESQRGHFTEFGCVVCHCSHAGTWWKCTSEGETRCTSE